MLTNLNDLFKFSMLSFTIRSALLPG